jgi:hypothetical protein
MMVNDLAELFERDLLKLRDEVRNFKDEDNLWRKPEGINNAAGNLALHLIGNINFHIGTTLAQNGYLRNREKEFSATHIPREEMIADISALVELVNSTLPNLTQQQLDAEYRGNSLGLKSTAYYLLHFYGHLNYHLGQINYLRRILEC